MTILRNATDVYKPYRHVPWCSVYMFITRVHCTWCFATHTAILMNFIQFCLWTNLQNFPIHVIRALDIDVFLYPMLTIQASSRLKRSANHLWNNSDVCPKKFGEWSHHRFSRLVTLLFHKWLIVRLNHKDVCILTLT
jgi:hypothetical protein